MMALTTPQLNAVLNTLHNDFNTNPGEVFLSLLRIKPDYQHEVLVRTTEYAPAILTAMEHHQTLSALYFERVNELTTRRCRHEVAELSSKANEFHFKAKTMTEEQI